MTPTPLPPWAEAVREKIERETGLSVSVCYLPRRGQVVFTANGLETWPRAWRGDEELTTGEQR